LSRSGSVLRGTGLAGQQLDEILLALPDADNAYVSLEHGSPGDLKQAADSHLQIRTQALDPSPHGVYTEGRSSSR
jgi:hypothetical protein